MQPYRPDETPVIQFKSAGSHLPHARHVDDDAGNSRWPADADNPASGLLFETADTDELNYRAELAMRPEGDRLFALWLPPCCLPPREATLDARFPMSSRGSTSAGGIGSLSEMYVNELS
jgi:type IV secretion system protein VirB4